MIDREGTDPADEEIDHAAWQGAVEQTFEEEQSFKEWLVERGFLDDDD